MIAAALAVAALAGGCSGTERLFGAASDADSAAQAAVGDPITNLVFGPPAKPAVTASGQPEIDCPSVDIRQGAATLTVAPPPGRDNQALGLRYQASIARTARECALAGGSVTMRVGVQGRVVLGPSGGPGKLDIPLRYAVVQEGVEPKTIATSLHRLPVIITPGQANVPFTHVAEDLAFPMPSRAELSHYVIYVGFDPQGLDERRPRRRPR